MVKGVRVKSVRVKRDVIRIFVKRDSGIGNLELGTGNWELGTEATTVSRYVPLARNYSTTGCLCLRPVPEYSALEERTKGRRRQKLKKP